MVYTCIKQPLPGIVYISGLTDIKIAYTTFTDFSVKFHLICKVYTDVGGIK